MDKKDFLSTTELAKILGISRIAVYKRIKKGQLSAEKVGRNYIIRKESLDGVLRETLTEAEKKQVEKAVKKTFKEYGETLRLLGKE